MRSIQIDELNNAVIPANESDSNAKEAWSDLIVRIDNHMLNSGSRKILVRCETNIYALYRGAAESELKVSDDTAWMLGGKVSPTTDQRQQSGGSSTSSTSSKTGDPDNSALQAGARRLFRYHLSSSYYLFYAVFVLIIITALS